MTTKTSELYFPQIRIWDYFSRTKHKLLSELDQSLEEVPLSMGQEVIVLFGVCFEWLFSNMENVMMISDRNYLSIYFSCKSYIQKVL